MQTKLEEFRALVEHATRQRYLAEWQHEQAKPDGMRYDLSIHDKESVCTIKIGPKYARVDVGSSGRYMVVLETGEIYGIKGYGVIHRWHHYGTLDTIHEWNWAPYKAIKLQTA